MKRNAWRLAWTLVCCLAGRAWAEGIKPFPLDPVELSRGVDVRGRDELAVDRFGVRYTFASAANKAAFEREPERYEAQHGGACGNMGPLSGACRSDIYTVHEGRLYLFASESCKKSFLANPGVKIENPDPAPTPGPREAAGAGPLLFEAVRAMGGSERLDTIRSISRERSFQEKSGGTLYDRLITMASRFGPGKWSHRQNDYWGAYKNAMVSGPRGGWFMGSSNEALHPASTAALERLFAHEPVVILRARGKPGFVAFDAGAGEIDGVATRKLSVWFDGSATVLHLNAEGTIVAAQYRGRGPKLTLGEMLVTFSDWRECDGLRLPATRRVTFNGESEPPTEWTWRVDEALDDAMFEPSTP